MTFTWPAGAVTHRHRQILRLWFDGEIWKGEAVADDSVETLENVARAVCNAQKCVLDHKKTIDYHTRQLATLDSLTLVAEERLRQALIAMRAALDAIDPPSLVDEVSLIRPIIVREDASLHSENKRLAVSGSGGGVGHAG